MKKIFVIFIVVLILLVSIFGRGIYFYEKYSVPNKDYFGVNYKEMLHPMSVSDKRQADKIMGMVDDAFSFVGNKKEADSCYGVLSRYCITEAAAVTERHNLKLITSNFTPKDGYLWYVYNQEALDNKNQILSESWDILVRLTLDKKAGEWVVVDTKEYP